MTGAEPRSAGNGTDANVDGDGAIRAATVRTTHADAALVAAALAPDDTDSIRTRVDGDTIECTVERPTTGGLRSTVDDYVVNLRVADRIVDRARAHLASVDGDTTADTTADTTTNI